MAPGESLHTSFRVAKSCASVSINVSPHVIDGLNGVLSCAFQRTR